MRRSAKLTTFWRIPATLLSHFPGLSLVGCRRTSQWEPGQAVAVFPNLEVAQCCRNEQNLVWGPAWSCTATRALHCLLSPGMRPSLNWEDKTSLIQYSVLGSSVITGSVPTAIPLPPDNWKYQNISISATQPGWDSLIAVLCLGLMFVFSLPVPECLIDEKKDEKLVIKS